MKTSTKIALTSLTGLFITLVVLASRLLPLFLTPEYVFDGLALTCLFVLPLIGATVLLGFVAAHGEMGGNAWLGMALAGVYAAVLLASFDPVTIATDRHQNVQARAAHPDQPPRRFVDEDAQVVCYEKAEFDGSHPALSCLPLSQTALKADHAAGTHG